MTQSPAFTLTFSMTEKSSSRFCGLMFWNRKLALMASPILAFSWSVLTVMYLRAERGGERGERGGRGERAR
jgi:hypothetical protein